MITHPARIAAVAVLLFLAPIGCAAKAQATAARPAPAPAQPARLVAQPQPAAAPTTSPVVAQVGGARVTLDQLQRPLIQGYGLNILLNLVQLEVAKENAAKAGVKVTSEDVAREIETTIEKMFEQSNEKLVVITFTTLKQFAEDVFADANEIGSSIDSLK